MLVPLLPFVKPGFVDIRPGGVKADPPPPTLPLPASAEAPAVSNNPAAAANAR
jgi:hypothetical protein